MRMSVFVSSLSHARERKREFVLSDDGDKEFNETEYSHVMA